VEVARADHAEDVVDAELSEGLPDRTRDDHR